MDAARWGCCTGQGCSPSNLTAALPSSSSEQTPADSGASSPEGVPRPLFLGPAVPQRMTFHEIVYPAADKWCLDGVACQLLLLLSSLLSSLGRYIRFTKCHQLHSVENLTVSPYGQAQVQEELEVEDCEGDHLDPGETNLIQIFNFMFEASNYVSKPARRQKGGLC